MKTVTIDCMTCLLKCTCQALAQNCSQLQLLNVGWCELITDAGVTALAVGCPDLRVVDFCGCLRITGSVRIFKTILSFETGFAG